MWFYLVGFNGISTVVGYIKSTPVYAFLDIYDLEVNKEIRSGSMKKSRKNKMTQIWWIYYECRR